MPEEEEERWLNKYFEPKFFKLRYVILIPVFMSFTGAFLMFLMGSIDIIEAILIAPHTHNLSLYMIKAIDKYLLGLVLIIFGYGVYDLFVSHLEATSRSSIKPDWMQFEDVGGLKSVIVEVVVVVLAVYFLQKVEASQTLSWPILVVPLGIFLLATGIGLFKYLTRR